MNWINLSGWAVYRLITKKRNPVDQGINRVLADCAGGTKGGPVLTVKSVGAEAKQVRLVLKQPERLPVFFLGIGARQSDIKKLCVRQRHKGSALTADFDKPGVPV